MRKIYTINNIVEFDSEKHLLNPKGEKGERVILNVPASRCLLLLIQRQHDIVCQKDFFDEVWHKHGAYVSANTFYQNISILRKGLLKAGLGDEIVKTVPRKGLTLTASTHISLDYNGTCQVQNQCALNNNAIKINEITGSIESRTPVDFIVKEKINYQGLKKRVYEITPAKIIVVIVATLVFSGCLLQSNSSSYFSHYKPVKIYGHCTYYVEEKYYDEARLREFIKKNKIACDEPSYPYNYLTSYPFSNDYSLIRCSKYITAGKRNECISEHILQKNEK